MACMAERGCSWEARMWLVQMSVERLWLRAGLCWIGLTHSDRRELRVPEAAAACTVQRKWVQV